jgi:hypothetical protein
MPNWVFNHLHIEGDAEQIQKVKAQLNKPITKHYKDKEGEKPTTYSNPIFSFWNIIAPPDDKLDEYFETHGYSPDKGKTGETEYNWYNFNNREWGTKWDCAVSDEQKYSDTELVEESETSLHYRFDTAWSPPSPAIEKLSEQYPELEITLSFEEESGWGGEYLFQEGSCSVIKEYDSPDSHADYVSLDREDSCECARSDDQEDWYDDCPGKKSKPIILSVVKDTEISQPKDLTKK